MPRSPHRLVRNHTVPPRHPQGRREGFTTGTAAAAAAKAACLVLLDRGWPESVTVTLPIERTLDIRINTLEYEDESARCGVVKDAGDDPDVTHGAEIFAAIRRVPEPGIHIKGGVGVGVVTQRGLELPVGSSAINPVPQRMIREAIAGVFGTDAPNPGVEVTISVPAGEELARRTFNARIGIVGGISILGTTGIVRAMSTAAWRASVVQAIDVAAANSVAHVVLTTGGRSETFARRLDPELPEMAFVQMGIFTGASLQRAQERGVPRVTLGAMIGKMSKTAAGKMQTHVAGNQVDCAFLGTVARDLGAPEELASAIASANTARHVQELIEAAGFVGFYNRLCELAAQQCAAVADRLTTEAVLFDFDGRVLGRRDMAEPIDVIGIGADGPASLRPELVERIRNADFLAGGERHLGLVGPTHGERFVIKNNLDQLAGELFLRFARQRCVVLASGDPLFYGIGTALRSSGVLGVFHLQGTPVFRFEPTVSSMQLAFARAGLDWQDAALASIHGRDLRLNLLELLGRPKIGLFTQDGDSPATVARFFLDRGAFGYWAIVCENLGTTDEKVSTWGTLAALAQQRFSPLNYLILSSYGTTLPVDLEKIQAIKRRRALVPGVPDEVFERPESSPEVMTRQEVRSVSLGKLIGGLQRGATVWDIGAGLGTVAVEVAVLRPAVEVVAVERDPERAEYLRFNVALFQAFNVRVVEGIAPEALANETGSPQAIFIGGSGGGLPAILDEAARRLEPNGRLVANFVTLENLTIALERLRQWGWPYEITEVHISRSDSLAGLTGLKPQRGVFIVSTEKRGPNA